jgi:plasmid maintenance system antidote protein VapI
MLDIFKSYLRDEDYYIIITKNGLLINNFNKIVNLDKNTLSILINNKKYIFKGNNFKIIRSIDKSLELESNIESVNIE